jgi:hypothetical protein
MHGGDKYRAKGGDMEQSNVTGEEKKRKIRG